MGVSLNHPSPQTISVNAKVPILDDKHAEKKQLCLRSLDLLPETLGKLGSFLV
jgi:hypothetical protein